MKFTFPKASSCKKLLFCFSAVRNSPAAVACFSTTSKTDPTDQKVGLNQTQLQSKNDYSTDYSSNEVLRHQRYSFRKLAQKDKQAAVYLLSQAFAEQEPLTNAYFKLINRDIQSQKLKLFTSFWNTFIDDSVDNQMSVATFDLQKNGELIGISVAKDLNYVPQGFEQKYMKGLNFISPAIALQEILISHTKPQNQNILKEKGVVMDIWGVALKKEHTGKKLLNKMVLGNETLGIKQGFKYGFSYASNFKTGIALSKQKYAKISEIDCKEFEFLGVKPFELIQQTQRRPSLWLKKLE